MKMVNQSTLGFFGKVAEYYILDDNQEVVPLYQLCEILGTSCSAEVKRLKRHTTGNDIVYIRTLAPCSDGSFKNRPIACVRLDKIPYWLCLVKSNLIKPEFREQVLRFQRAIIDATWKIYGPSILPPEILAKLGDKFENYGQSETKIQPTDLIIVPPSQTP